MQNLNDKDILVIGKTELRSRLFIGTGKFSNNAIIGDCITKSDSSIVTVAVRRIDFEMPEENMLRYIPKECIVMPNTSGARTSKDAIRIARLAREAGCGNWIKIEVISDNRYLLPDNYETIKATEILAAEGFIVLPYMNPDLMVAKALKDAGAAAIMPLGAPIGTNRGLKMKEMIRILIEEIDLPIVVDAGIGRPSHAAEAMEMGAAAVLVNTAIATAKDPVTTSLAFSLAVKAGRLSFQSGAPKSYQLANASSPLEGFLDSLE